MGKIKMVTYRSRKGWLEHRTGIGGSDAEPYLDLILGLPTLISITTRQARTFHRISRIRM